MNYYERHLGDYAKDTAHLSMLEHGAYTLLLDRYYSSEQGIPADQVHRLTRARSREEKAAVDAVLAEFFTLHDGVWVNGRAEQVIATYQDEAPNRESKRENATERQRRSRERRKQLFDALREHGLVPHWDTKTAELQAMLKRVTGATGDAHVTQPVTRDNTATQTPDTSNHTQSQDTHTVTPTEAGRVSLLMRRAGISDGSPGHPDLLALIDAGATDAEFEQAAASAIAKGKGFAYALGVLKGQRRDAAENAGAMHRGAMQQTAARDRKSRQLETAALMTGAKRATPQSQPETIDVDARVIAP